MESRPAAPRDAGDPLRSQRQRRRPGADAGHLDHLRDAVAGRRTAHGALDPGHPVLRPSRQPDGRRLRAGRRRAGGCRGRSRVRLRDGRRVLRRVRAVRQGRPHRRPTPAVRGHDATARRCVSAFRRRGHVRRRHRARRLRRGHDPWSHDVGAGRDAGQPAARPRRPRRARCDHGADHGGRLDAGDAARFEPARPRRRSRAPLGDQGDRRPQRRDARRGRRRARPDRRAVGHGRAAGCERARRTTRSTGCAACARSAPAAPADRERARRRAALEAHPAVSEVRHPGLESHPQHELAARQMRLTGGMLAFELVGGLPPGPPCSRRSRCAARRRRWAGRRP